MDLAYECLRQKKSTMSFSKENNIEYKHLAEAITHSHYLRRIKKLKQMHADGMLNKTVGVKKEEDHEELKFVQVPRINQIPLSQPIEIKEIEIQREETQQEVVEKQNDIELIISKGVKVVVSPNVGTEKLIKIIELLKDL